MRPEMASKLRRAIWRQRLKSYGPTMLLLLACVALGGYFFSFKLGRLDPSVSETLVPGTVLTAHRVAGRAAIFIAHVRLEDGNEVDADSTLAAPLFASEPVVISQVRHASGKISYHVLQVKN